MAMTALQFQAWKDSVKASLVAAGFSATNVQAGIDAAEAELVKQVLMEQSPDLKALMVASIQTVIQQAKSILSGG